jgi:LacI family transcriptional regulator
VVSIFDIARATNCSIATVSCAINGKGRVSALTRKRILEACTALGYAPNAAGRHLRLQRTETVGLLLYPTCASEFRNSFAADVIEGLENRLIAANYHLLLGGYHPQVTAGALPQFIGQGRVDGVILLGKYPSAILAALRHVPVPMLILDSEDERGAIDSITTDGYAAGRQAVSYLVERGHRRIVMLAYDHDFHNPVQRRRGFLESMTTHGLWTHDRSLVSGFNDDADGCRLLHQRLTEPEPPTAVICENDHLALTVIRRLTADGVRVPEQLSVIGFTDDADSAVSHPPLTTFHIAKQDLGRLGADMMLARIAEPERAVLQRRVPAALIERQSVLALPTP